MLDVLGIDSTRSVQTALLVDTVARLIMVGFDLRCRNRLFVDVVHVSDFCESLGGDKDEVDKQRGDRLALCTRIVRLLVLGPIIACH